MLNIRILALILLSLWHSSGPIWAIEKCDLVEKGLLHAGEDIARLESKQDELKLIEEALDHPTNPGLKKVTNVDEATEHAAQTIHSKTPAHPKLAEAESLSHQDDLLEGINPEVRKKLEAAGFDRSAYIRGVADSDMGKLDIYKELLTKKSAKSDLLLNMLTGRKPPGAAGDALRELMDEMGFKGKWPLNGNFDNDALRALFDKHKVLQGYLHEFPGMADAMLLLENGAITPAQFKKQLAANLFHNGPAEGFWKLINDVFVPGSLGKDPQAFKFFEGTVFQGQKTAEGLIKPVYPSPKSFEGAVHSLFDRMSQATKGGVIKIFEEVKGFDPKGPLGLMDDLLVNNPRNTLKQIDELDKVGATLGDAKKAKALDELTGAGKARLNQYIADVDKGIKSTKENGAVTSLEIKYPDGHKVVFSNPPASDPSKGAQILNISADGTVKVKATFTDPKQLSGSGPFADELKAEVKKYLEMNEAQHGDPVKGLLK